MFDCFGERGRERADPTWMLLLRLRGTYQHPTSVSFTSEVGAKGAVDHWLHAYCCRRFVSHVPDGDAIENHGSIFLGTA